MLINKRAKILLTLFLGFGVGFILANFTQVLSVLQASEAQSEPIVKTKIEEFWQDSDLQLEDLTRLVNNKTCVLSEKHFLACINSVVNALSVKQKRLSLSGEILNVSSDINSLDNFSEKEKLIPFTKIFQEHIQYSFDFETLWKKILALKSNATPEKYLIAQGINGYLSVFKDPHTYILPYEYFDQVTSASERSPYFVGISLEKVKGEIFIKKIINNSDADLAGLKVGDKVVSLNGYEGSKLSLAQASRILRDPDARQFSFAVNRSLPATSQSENLIKIVKRSYRVLSQVSSEIINTNRNIGLIHISKFSKNTCRDVHTAIQSMKMSQVSSIVIDLRDNPGGHLSEVACMAGLFIGENKKIYSVQYFDVSKDSETVLTSSSMIYTGPLAILVNSSSASASELFAGAMQEYRRAIIIGSKTFGKGTFQEVENWGSTDKVGLFRTRGFYLLPNGESTQFYGVTPDFEIAEDRLTVENEEESYLNPIKPQIIGSRVKKLNFTFATCSQSYGSTFNTANALTDPNIVNDQVLSKAIGLLTCSELMSYVATQYYELSSVNQVEN